MTKVASNTRPILTPTGRWEVHHTDNGLHAVCGMHEVIVRLFPHSQQYHTTFMEDGVPSSQAFALYMGSLLQVAMALFNRLETQRMSLVSQADLPQNQETLNAS